MGIDEKKLDEKEILNFEFKKEYMSLHPLVSYGGNYVFESEYVEEKDWEKREYAPKIMVATST